MLIFMRLTTPDEIPQLEPPDSLHLRAAEGWLGLGDLVSASDELEKIQPQLRAHPAVLMTRCNIYEAANKWEMVIPVYNTLVGQLPGIQVPWIMRSFALHELKRTQEAFNLLLPAVQKFPAESIVRYNLACYTCQLGKLQEAMAWLEQAIDLAGRDEDIRMKALDDLDLQPLWKEIGDL
jgi:tetratricopeptide (TPR) repeat protein